ncbi:glycosyltransferase [Polynucleobacter paneuropaeus]|nr:glycosyltransferase [Polynucleobacter paneuropaeus]
MSPLISVVIPVFNRGWQLHRALDSLKVQTFSNFEVIVCDDGSTDDSVVIAKKFEGVLNLQIVQMPNSGGPATPRNRGVAVARGEWIAFLDSDDWWDATRLETILPHLNNQHDLVYHPLRVVKDSQIISSRERRMQVGSNFECKPLRHMATIGNPLATSAVVVRKSALDKVGGMDSQEALMALEDFDCWMRLAEAGTRFYFLNQCLGNYWVGGDAISAISERLIERQKFLFERHFALFDKAYQPQALARQNFVLGMVYLRLGNHFESALGYMNLAYPLPTLRMAIKRLLVICWLKFKLNQFLGATFKK